MQAINYLLSARITDIIDMLIVAYIIYRLIGLIRRTNSNRVAKGVVIIIFSLWVSSWLQLTVVNFILRKTVELGLLALVVLFQPELRRILERVGSGKILSFLRGNVNARSVDSAITQTVIACSTMANEKTGALIVFERINKLDNQMNTGTIINAETTAELRAASRWRASLIMRSILTCLNSSGQASELPYATSWKTRRRNARK